MRRLGPEAAHQRSVCVGVWQDEPPWFRLPGTVGWMSFILSYNLFNISYKYISLLKLRLVPLFIDNINIIILYIFPLLIPFIQAHCAVPSLAVAIATFGPDCIVAFIVS